MSLISIIGTPLYQWETGRKLKIIPLRGMRVDSVHISNYGDSTALVVKPREENGAYIADIPNILLQDDRSIAVYSVNISEDKTETLRECVFSIQKRAKPSDYIYTETEVFTYKDLEARVAKLEGENPDDGGAEPGEAGGYYTPVVEQIDDKTIKMSFVGSKPDMISIKPKTITLPGCGISPIEKTEDMTQPVGIDENGQLWVAPIGGGGACPLTVETITIGEIGNVPVTGIELDYSTMSINEGDSFQLAASVLPENATNNVVGWRSSDNSIATVVNGYVAAISGGSVTITAYSLENNAITASCTVTVSAESGGGGSTTDGKIMILDLTPVNTGVILKKDGVTEFSHSSCYGYFVIPYSEGMVVSTVMTSSFAGSTYGPIFVRENGTLTHVTPESEVIAGAITNYTATLTGYSENAEVIVNVTNVGGYKDRCYYIPGGES